MTTKQATQGTGGINFAGAKQSTSAGVGAIKGLAEAQEGDTLVVEGITYAVKDVAGKRIIAVGGGQTKTFWK